MYNVQFVRLNSHRCGEQNKNSVIAAMLLLRVVQSQNLEFIISCYIESYHGQNEDHSVHSCISKALSHDGNIFVLLQLHAVFKLASRQNSYDINSLKFNKFYDLKT